METSKCDIEHCVHFVMYARKMNWKTFSFYICVFLSLFVNIVTTQDPVKVTTKSTSNEGNPLSLNSSFEKSHDQTSSLDSIKASRYLNSSSTIANFSLPESIASDRFSLNDTFVVEVSASIAEIKDMSQTSSQTNKLVSSETKNKDNDTGRRVGPPPPLMVPPPPFPPEDVIENKRKFDDTLTTINTDFQPRAQNIPLEMREAMLDPKNIIVQSDIITTAPKVTVTQKDELNTFDPLMLPLPPPPMEQKTSFANVHKTNMMSIETVSPGISPGGASLLATGSVSQESKTETSFTGNNEKQINEHELPPIDLPPPPPPHEAILSDKRDSPSEIWDIAISNSDNPPPPIDLKTSSSVNKNQLQTPLENVAISSGKSVPPVSANLPPIDVDSSSGNKKQTQMDNIVMPSVDNLPSEGKISLSSLEMTLRPLIENISSSDNIPSVRETSISSSDKTTSPVDQTSRTPIKVTTLSSDRTILPTHETDSNALVDSNLPLPNINATEDVLLPEKIPGLSNAEWVSSSTEKETATLSSSRSKLHETDISTSNHNLDIQVPIPKLTQDILSPAYLTDKNISSEIAEANVSTLASDKSVLEPVFSVDLPAESIEANKTSFEKVSPEQNKTLSLFDMFAPQSTRSNVPSTNPYPGNLSTVLLAADESISNISEAVSQHTTTPIFSLEINSTNETFQNVNKGQSSSVLVSRSNGKHFLNIDVDSSSYSIMKPESPSTKEYMTTSTPNVQTEYFSLSPTNEESTLLPSDIDTTTNSSMSSPDLLNIGDSSQDQSILFENESSTKSHTLSTILTEEILTTDEVVTTQQPFIKSTDQIIGISKATLQTTLQPSYQYIETTTLQPETTTDSMVSLHSPTPLQSTKPAKQMQLQIFDLPPPPVLNFKRERTEESMQNVQNTVTDMQFEPFDIPPPPPNMGTVQKKPETSSGSFQTLAQQQSGLGVSDPKIATNIAKSSGKTTDQRSQLEKFLSFFQPDSLHFNIQPWSIQSYRQHKMQTIVTKTTTKQPIFKQTSSNNNNNNELVRKMIETIEQVRNKPFYESNIQPFVAPGLRTNQKLKVHNLRSTRTTSHKNSNKNFNSAHSKITNVDSFIQKDSNAPPQISAPSIVTSGIPRSGEHLSTNSNPDRQMVRKSPTKQLRTTKHSIELPQPALARHVKNAIRKERIAFKVPVLKEEQKVERNMNYNREVNIKSSYLNSLPQTYKFERIQQPKILRKMITKNRNDIQSNGFLPQNGIKNKRMETPLGINDVDGFNAFKSDQIISNSIGKPDYKEVNIPSKELKQRNWNEPPPPIDMRSENTPAFSVSYVPPPPPLPKYKPSVEKRPYSEALTTSTPSIILPTTHIIITTEGIKGTTEDNVTIEADPSYKKDLTNPQVVCQNCTYISNFCYLREPSNCNRFVVCYKQGHRIRATEKECSFGLFWSESKLACIQSSLADCKTDPCRNKGVRSHPYIDKCRAYWTCRRKRSDARCCPNGYSFGGGSRSCVPDKTCKTECMSKDPVVKNICHLQKVPQSPYEYQDGGMIRSCAPGTRFELSVCTCIRSNVGNNPVEETPKENENYQCGPVVKLDFSGRTHDAFDDKSGNSQSIGVFDVVQTMREQALFNGRGSLTLWRFSNVELGPELAVKFRFYAPGQSHRSETLLSNCIGQKEGAAIDIRLETDILEIVFTVKTTKSPEAHMRMFYQLSQWNEVILRYDGSSLSAAIGQVSKTIFVEGVIPTKHAAISIGGCGKDDGFVGYMDDVVIYNECIPDDVRDLVFE